MSDLVGTQIVGFLTHRLILSYNIRFRLRIKLWISFIHKSNETVIPQYYSQMECTCLGPADCGSDKYPYRHNGCVDNLIHHLSGEIRDLDVDEKGQSTKYKLIGAVIHKGDGSGGQYYSFALHQPDNEAPKWYKFADDDVTECQLEDDEVR